MTTVVPPAGQGGNLTGDARPVEIPAFPRAPRRTRWAIFRNTLLALFLREVGQRYGASRFGYPWAIAQPILMVLILSLAHSLFASGKHGLYGVSGAYFFALGVVPFFVFQNAYQRAMGAIRSARGVFSYREVRPFDVVLVRCGIEYVILVVVMLMLMFGFWWFDIAADFENPLALLGAATLLFLMALGLGLIADVAITRSEDTRRFFGLLERPLFFTSGIFFVVEILPEPLRGWLLWNPLLHAIDLGRGAMLSQYESPCSWLYASLWAFGLMFVGLAQYQRYLYRLLAA